MWAWKSSQIKIIHVQFQSVVWLTLWYDFDSVPWQRRDQVGLNASDFRLWRTNIFAFESKLCIPHTVDFCFWETKVFVFDGNSVICTQQIFVFKIPAGKVAWTTEIIWHQRARSLVIQYSYFSLWDVFVMWNPHTKDFSLSSLKSNELNLEDSLWKTEIFVSAAYGIFLSLKDQKQISSSLKDKNMPCAFVLNKYKITSLFLWLFCKPQEKPSAKNNGSWRICVFTLYLLERFIWTDFII